LFYYKVRAVNAGGSSGYSNETSARTRGIVPSILPVGNVYVRFDSTVVLPVEATASAPVDITLQVDNLPDFAVFQQTGNGKGTITFTPSQSDRGGYNGIKITAANPQNDINTLQFNLTVDSNYHPVLNNISGISVNEKDSIQVLLSATDQDVNDYLSWGFPGMPGFATASPANRNASITFRPTYGDDGIYTIKVTVNDNHNGKDTASFTVSVSHVDVTDPDDGTVPLKPDNVTAEFTDSLDAVEIKWRNRAYNARYNEVFRSTSLSGYYTVINSADTTNADSTSYIDNTVAGNTAYFYLVRAVNDSGGAGSGIIKIITPSKKPVIQDVDDIYIKRDSVKSIPIIATDDPGDIITLLFHDLPGFASFTESGNGSGVLFLSAVNAVAGVYPVIINAIDNYGAFSQKRINIIVTEENIKHFYVNFNNTDYPVTDPLWNSFNSSKTGGTQVAANTTLSNLKDETGTSATLSVKLLNSWPQNYLGVVTGNNSGIFPDAVMATGYYFTVQASAPQKTIRLAGLKTDKKYDLTFYGNRSVGTDQLTHYTAGTQTVTLNAKNNTSNTVKMTGLSANGQGEIDIVVDAVMGKYAVINAMVIKEHPGN
ncbi:MAG TPA: hypothetical protein PLL71_06500, partial [Agriterribacter sp.]|nr:hypothetical protein [Agriterribacter sp.]